MIRFMRDGITHPIVGAMIGFVAGSLVAQFKHIQTKG